jgi:hypothetical protein
MFVSIQKNIMLLNTQETRNESWASLSMSRGRLEKHRVHGAMKIPTSKVLAVVTHMKFTEINGTLKEVPSN